MTRRSAPAARCPVCKAPAHADFRPFCSDHCAKVDLHRWFSGAYATPGDRAPPDAARDAKDDDDA